MTDESEAQRFYVLLGVEGLMEHKRTAWLRRESSKKAWLQFSEQAGMTPDQAMDFALDRKGKSYNLVSVGPEAPQYIRDRCEVIARMARLEG